MSNVMLTIGGIDIREIPQHQCETVVKCVQDVVDEKARAKGKRYGANVSARRLEMKLFNFLNLSYKGGVTDNR